MGRISLIISSGLGLGYIPKGSGTAGTLWGVLLFWLMSGWGEPAFGLVTALLVLLAVFFSHFAEKRLGSHDSSIIVSDEVVGYLVTVVGIGFTWPRAVLAFVLFRIFDIFKPFPISYVDRRVPGAWGVVLDDVVAGIFANLLLRLVLFYWEGL